MRVTSAVSTLLVFVSPLVVTAHPQFWRSSAKTKRAASILIDPPAQPALPAPSDGKAKIAATSLVQGDVQGDILIGMKKKKELFYFFTISDSADFKTKLSSVISPLITSTSQLLSTDAQPTTLLNIAFSQQGLTTIGITDDFADADFKKGHPASAPGDFKDQTSKWVSALSSSSGIHGVMLFASDTTENIAASVADLEGKMGGAISKVYELQGAARPNEEEGHEHFGFMDGISQPAVTGFNTALTGQRSIPAGQILLGVDGDKSQASRPSWATGGSFLVFRQLQQFVPEFNKFLLDNAVQKEGLTTQQGADLLGARMMGRWKSGAPIQLSPDADDVSLANDRNQNNNFDFSQADDLASKCPFSAHIRKTNPRGDLGSSAGNMIIRAGIPYGPEVTDGEKAANASDSSQERGLAFVAYQSNIGTGFKTLQKTWANNENFVKSGSGLDPIVGTNGNASFFSAGLDPTDPAKKITFVSDFVMSRGGEYFFAPPISAISGKLSQ